MKPWNTVPRAPSELLVVFGTITIFTLVLFANCHTTGKNSSGTLFFTTSENFRAWCFSLNVEKLFTMATSAWSFFQVFHSAAARLHNTLLTGVLLCWDDCLFPILPRQLLKYIETC